jgi:AAA family ATPase
VDGPRRTFIVEAIDNDSNGFGQCSASSVTITNQAHESSQALSQSSKVTSLQVANIAGVDQALEKLNGFLSEFTMDFAFPWAHRSGAVLLHGGHGSGKTFILNKIANTGWGKVYRVKRKDAKASQIEKVFNDAK